jgi:multiple sugar transport system permease protein
MKKKEKEIVVARKKESTSKLIIRIVITLIIIAVTIMMLVPFLWMISASFKTEKDVMAIPIQWIPSYFYPNNYAKVLSIGTKSSTNYHFVLSYWNSLKVATISTVVAVLSSTMAGYAFAKLKFKGSNVLFIVYLAQMMVPSQLTLIPRFVIFSQLGLTNTHFALIAPKIIAVSSTFMLRQSFLSAPDDLREAAMIDGAGEYRIWGQIMVPLVKPTIAATATVQFLDAWNSYLDPLVFISNWRKWTLPLALNQFIGAEVTQYNLIMAACCMAVVPVFIVFLCGQKYFLKGLMVGAVKG